MVSPTEEVLNKLKGLIFPNTRSIDKTPGRVYHDCLLDPLVGSTKVAKTEEHEKISPALRANLALTKRDVSIPVDYELLLKAVEDYHGVRTRVAALLEEYFHPMRNLDIVAKSLRNVCGGSMFHYYERSPERARCAELFVRLFEALYEDDMPDAVVGNIFRANLDFLVVLNNSPHGADYHNAIERVIESLTKIFQQRPIVFLPYSNYVRNIGKRLAGQPEFIGNFAGLYRLFAVHGLEVFKEKVDFHGWLKAQRIELDKHHSHGIAELREDYISSALKELARETNPEQILAQPNINDLLNFTIDRANEIENPVNRIEFYVYLGSIEELRYRDMDILRNLHASLQSVCDESSEDAIIQAVDLVTGHLKARTSGPKHTLFKCLERLGKEIAKKKNVKLTDHFIEQVIDTGFESPEIVGVSEEWQTQLNPHHLECLRTWLNIIGQDPIGYERLLSALIINLHYRKVFISDTDLFQRDVSELLNSGVADVFNMTIQLVTFFPVFFNEIGSEGELRDVSTRVDQLTHRQDPIVHFIRKQSHAESNNRLIGFARSILAFWKDGDAGPLREYLPETVFDSISKESHHFQSAHEILEQLESRFGLTISDFDAIDPETLRQHIDQVGERSPEERERVFLMIRFYRLLKQKYSYDSGQLLHDLKTSNLIGSDTKEQLVRSFENGNPWRLVTCGNRALLELKKNITDARVTRASENIYLKRHIAAGIPSMYGTYRERKFDSIGLFLCIKAFLKKHLEEIVADFNFRYITRGSMREAYEIMQQMLLGLRVCGLPVEDLSTKVELLKRSISAGNITAGQYLNIFEFIARAVSDIVENNYIAVHNNNLRMISRQILAENGCPEDQVDKKANEISEEFLRSVISSTYAIQEFDLFLTKILQSLRSMTKTLDDHSCDLILNYSPGKLIALINEPLLDHEDQLYLGYKGYALKKLKALSLPIPEGFIVSTELFNILPAMSYEDLRRDTRERVLPALRKLEEFTGRELGNPDRLLLLSVRSGAAFSMPGMMDTILNVGMNDEIVEKLAKKHNYGWTSWDCYRRFLQNFAMSCGLDRNLFDDIMIRFKEKYTVTRKLQFSPAQMREMAFEYKRTAIEHGVTFIDDPFDQLMKAIYLVLRSWDSDPAKVYRRQMQLSDDWGTGVIVQEMILGNINYDSGTGVIFTRNPRVLSAGIDLFGDFVMCSQGEDVVAGLVNPYPISEKQRIAYSPNQNISLEKIYPEIYSKLKEIASLLTSKHGYEHQEIEFTFESSKPEDLYILQTKPMSVGRQDEIPVFANPQKAHETLLATGVGVSGGAMSGLVAFTQDDIKSLRVSHSGENVILLRPDTVPEDISLVLAVDGLLTGRGGVTSHASVTAKRIGKTCVVNCSELVVSETNKYARIGAQELRPGDMISIDGHSGFVCSGKHEIKKSREQVIPF